METDTRRIKKILILLIIIFVIGILGFMLIERWDIFDSFYMVLTTLTTIGYGEIRPLSFSGRIFNSVFILLGVMFVLYSLTTLATLFIEGTFQQIFWRKRMLQRIKTLKNHYIICGIGNVGFYIASVLHNEKKSFIAIDNKEHSIKIAEKNNWNYIQGDASTEEILLEAGMENAAGIAVTTNSDAINLYIVLTARLINPKCIIIARANSPEAHDKLVKAGASRVISPHEAGGKLILSALLKPDVADFLDSTFSPHEGITIEELKISKTSSLLGKTIKEADLHHNIGVTIIVVIKHETKTPITNPPSSTLLEYKDTILVVGNKKQIAQLKKL